MLTEDFCSFEVAKLLKEKGFDELCIFKYSSEGVRMKAGVAIDEWQNSELDDDECSCPSQSMAMKWLREVHLLHVYAEYHSFFQECPKKLYYHWVPFVKPLPQCKCKRPLNNVFYEIDEYYNSYEEVVEAACIYALKNLI